MGACSRSDVVKIIDELLLDLRENPDSWENPTLERYLEAMGRWIEDMGRKQDDPPSWEYIIDILEAARIYE